MSRQELEAAALASADHWLKTKGYIALVDVFIAMGKLTPAQHEDWRMGRKSYLEAVIQLNLSQINVVCRTVHNSAAKGELKPSLTAYVKWGNGNRTPLRFTKSGAPELERSWATHYLAIRPAKPHSNPQPAAESPPTNMSATAPPNTP